MEKGIRLRIKFLPIAYTVSTEITCHAFDLGAYCIILFLKRCIMAKSANSFGKIATKISALQAKADKLSAEIKALSALVAAEGKKAAAAPAAKAAAKEEVKEVDKEAAEESGVEGLGALFG